MVKKSVQGEVEDIKNQLKRALADYSNLQKRFEEEKRYLVKYANATLLLKLLDVLDSLEEAGKHLQDEGLNLSIKKFKEILETEGVREIGAGGKKFDPNFHEAMEVLEGKEDGKIVGIVQKGYTLDDKVLRPAKVKVSKKQNA